MANRNWGDGMLRGHAKEFLSATRRNISVCRATKGKMAGASSQSSSNDTRNRPLIIAAYAAAAIFGILFWSFIVWLTL
jgi:hypothetical protein